MNRPAPISVVSDQRRTKSTIWSRTSCGTQTPVRVPQDFFLGQCAPPSTRPGPHPSAGFSSPDIRSVPVRPGGWAEPSAGRQPLRFQRTPSATDRTSSDAAHAPRTDLRSAPSPTDAALEWPPSRLLCSSYVVVSSVLSVSLTEKRPLHFQLRRNTSRNCRLRTTYWRLFWERRKHANLDEI